MTSGFISEHFSWEEVTHSETASRLGIQNSVPESLIPAITNTAKRLERVRALLEAPLTITSWYRCLELNRALKSKDDSQHPKGEAVDFISPKFGNPLDICRRLIQFSELVPFDQLILEHTWVHISFCDPSIKPRKQVLSLLKSGQYAISLTDSQGVSYD